MYYKIRIKDNPEYYVKGTPGYMSKDKSGRIFQSIGQLRTFLTNVMNQDTRYNKYEKSSDHRNRIANWEIIEYEMVEKEIKGVHEIITAKKLKELIMR
jgi:hypothetical protein